MKLSSPSSNKICMSKTIPPLLFAFMVFTGKTSLFLCFPVQKLVTGSSEQSNKTFTLYKRYPSASKGSATMTYYCVNTENFKHTKNKLNEIYFARLFYITGHILPTALQRNSIVSASKGHNKKYNFVNNMSF
jgi:hypothetical protein